MLTKINLLGLKVTSVWAIYLQYAFSRYFYPEWLTIKKLVPEPTKFTMHTVSHTVSHLLECYISQVSGVAIQLRLRYSQSLKPCELQKLIPNHQSSFCWICLPLLTLSIIRSSYPPSHHWTSLEFHFAGLNPISLVGLSRWPGEGRYPKHINWSPGFPRARFLDPSSSPHTLHHWVHHTGTWLLLPFLRWWHIALSLISTRWSNGSRTDLRLLGRHLGMDERTSPTAQPGKNWASCLPCHSNSAAWLHDSVRFINNYPISFGQKSWCNLWWPAHLKRAHCKDCSILQVCTTQHQKDQALSDRACCTTSCPGPCHF